MSKTKSLADKIFLKSDKGFTLVELMVAVGIMAIVIFGALSFLYTSRKIAHELEIKYGITKFHNEVKQILRDPLACTWTLSKGIIHGKISSIMNSAGQPVYSTWDATTPEQWLYDKGRFKIMKLHSYESEPTETRFIEVTYGLVGKEFEKKTYKKVLFLQDYYLSEVVDTVKKEPTPGAHFEGESCALRDNRLFPTSYKFATCISDNGMACQPTCSFGYTALTAVTIKLYNDKSETIIICGT